MTAIESQARAQGWTTIDERDLWLGALRGVARGDLSDFGSIRHIYDAARPGYLIGLSADERKAWERVEFFIEEIAMKYGPSDAPAEMLEYVGITRP